ncbi:MAG: hypothetical protein ACOX85_11700, partial [Candidatus Pararuminococcus gallinarum]
ISSNWSIAHFPVETKKRHPNSICIRMAAFVLAFLGLRKLFFYTSLCTSLSAHLKQCYDRASPASC